MSRSSRPSPFKRSISALSPASQGSNSGATKAPSQTQNSAAAASPEAPAPDAGVAAAAPAQNGSTTRIASANGGTAATTRRSSAATGTRTRTNTPVPATFAGPPTGRHTGPMAFEPLKDDAVRRSRKFIGRHKGLLTEPGARVVDFVRRNRAAFGVLALLCVVSLGALFAYQAWQNAYSEEAQRQLEARNEALNDGSWSALLEYAEQYEIEPGDQEFFEALEFAYREELDRKIAEAEDAMRTGDPDVVLALPNELDELTRTWLDYAGDDEVPVSVDGLVEQRLERFKRRAVTILESRLIDAADAAQSDIEAGEIEAGVTRWVEEKQAVRTLMGAFTFPAREREQLDSATASNETSVLRTVEQQQIVALRDAFEAARRRVEAEPMALDGFLVERTRLLEQARRYADDYGMSERAVIGLERTADQHAEQLARSLRDSLAARVDRERARNSQALRDGTNPAEVIDRYRTSTAGLLNDGRASGVRREHR